ncbi:hypothetical protein R70331_24860 [Paenibacillus sp. FSL R7-0331]|nr:hypothetical protein R70331_24860 [Paenibacillus sp. FSL R7-0331]
MLRVINGIMCYILGNVFSLLYYERRYLRGKYFSGRFFGVFSIGWKWVVRDSINRLLFGFNKEIPFPVSPKIQVGNYKDIEFHVDDLNNFQGQGNYYQTYNGGKIIIGRGTYIAANVGIITENHDIYDPDNHVNPKNVILGEKCWVGMNSVILPGVTLGPHTTVGAGSVVTKSFPDGYAVIVGNPARKIKDLKD